RERGEAEERRRLAAERHAHGAETLLDLLLGLVGGLLRQRDMRPGVSADGVALRGHLLEYVGMPERVLADGEERRLDAMRGERAQHRGRGGRPRAVVEREHDLALAEKVVLLEVLEAEARAAGGVDLDHPRSAERAR